jgi:hypothetical protein
MLNSGFDEITNPRLRLERAWRGFLKERRHVPGRSTPVVREDRAAGDEEMAGDSA